MERTRRELALPSRTRRTRAERSNPPPRWVCSWWRPRRSFSLPFPTSSPSILPIRKRSNQRHQPTQLLVPRRQEFLDREICQKEACCLACDANVGRSAVTLCDTVVFPVVQVREMCCGDRLPSGRHLLPCRASDARVNRTNENRVSETRKDPIPGKFRACAQSSRGWRGSPVDGRPPPSSRRKGPAHSDLRPLCRRWCFACSRFLVYRLRLATCTDWPSVEMRVRLASGFRTFDRWIENAFANPRICNFERFTRTFVVEALRK